ncbi:ABC transporter ATP-binding protein [Flavobacterium caseinilyticum]|uniref:ATP-binding cassette domain-containing protein n=1 Tax=Flavobacterium caseinilyticum TaxID=2541732 RepID=A0A4R5ARZ2_9FLAO|nr:polysaccharide ABC transporter ATP-binding protein [Flavobacterium caseinilyticum]TDD75928.1 ATP-binding cassette domain-containing protein [Flavobacterium caseinilyticum]
MNKLAIKAENISKQYRLGEVGTGTLSHDLNRFWHKIRSKEDPYLKIGESNDRTSKGGSDYVWSLRDINFQVEQGDAVGIIGRNGAGKSTLLKLLSKVTKPTTGNFKINGRIASLLEVGTGFNPEMTGRENIYLNGAILGMRRQEITRKFDEIVEFSGVERYIDTPVKRYSSGMYVRLAFAVAAHLESEILIVDEVLAVGDAEFQKKCLGKMGDVSRGEGRTVLFVSHNMGAIQNLCNKGIVLANGEISHIGDVESSIHDYIKKNTTAVNLLELKERKGSGVIKIAEINVFGSTRETKPQTGLPCNIEVVIANLGNVNFSDVEFDVCVDDQFGQNILWMSNTLLGNSVNFVGNVLLFKMDRLLLNDGIYYITIYTTVKKDLADWVQNAVSFEVIEGDFYGSGKKVPSLLSKVVVDYNVEYS